MCDLIDLSSPDPRKLVKSKLASPLIPGPETPVDKNNEEKTIHTIDFVSKTKRSSLDNNPFDKVYKETTDYVARKDDPFEAVLEKARESAEKYSNENRADFTPKRRRHSEILKMNKTLDEPLLQGILNRNFNQLIKQSRYQAGEHSVVGDLNNVDVLNQTREQDKSRALNGIISPHIIIYPPSPGNNSVLNQSAMNDSLSEGSGSSGETEFKDKVAERVSICIENAEPCSNSVSDIQIELLNPSRLRRSMSQGSKTSPQKEIQFRPRSRSIIDTLKGSNSQNKSRVSSVSSNTDLVNNAFMETGSTMNSESLDVSRISATPRLSQSSVVSGGSLYSHSSMNRAFILDSQSSSSRMFGSTSSAKSSLNLSSISRSTGAGNFLLKTPLKTPVKIADLELRLEKIKIQSMGSIGALPLYSPNHKVENFLRSDGVPTPYRRSEKHHESEAKLIDTDVFVPTFDGEDFNGEKIDSASNCSSDSVFIDNEKVDQSVFREAKILARTFDELAHQSTSFSSGDDLLYTRPRWNFDILPVSDDDEAVVDNLIELPGSPLRNETDERSGQNADDRQITAEKLTESKVSQDVKELETEFIDQDVSKNKVMAATLLLDLEKIVHRENNPEAITLLENLEKVLGVKYENNAQLLATCVQWTNNLSKSPNKSATKLGSNENIRHESLEKSHEDNNDARLSNSIKNLNVDDEKAINMSKKSIITDISPSVEEKKENLLEEPDDKLNVLKNEDKSLVEQTEALELITNLSKILGGRNNDSSPLSVLTNLRQLLNLATNQLNFENSQAPKSQDRESATEIQRKDVIPQKKPSTKPKLDANKSGRKKSMDSSTKVQNSAQTSIKRSMSLGSAHHTVAPGASGAKEKTKTHYKSLKKALSCGAVPKPDTQEKSSSKAAEAGRSRSSTITGTSKYKLKKKSESESVAGKKGPLKALIPVGNMQRRGSMSTKVAPISLPRTPPKSSATVPSTFTSATSSTPNPTAALVVSKKSPKTKPVASSTPDGGTSKARRIRLQFSKSTSKPKFSCNISPVTPLPTQSITGSVIPKRSFKDHRHNKTLSPPKRRGSQEAPCLNTTESGIPKYSPLAGFARRNSKETLETSGSPKSSLVKSQTPKKPLLVQSKSGIQVPQSPLKTMNNQNSKFKPLNLISKLRRGSNGSNVSDKENCA